MKPDLITPWPMHLDFPLWRQQLRRIRGHFDKVVIIFTHMNAKGDYRSFVRDALKDDQCIIKDNNEVSGDQDWRNVATNKGLEYCNSEWVFFTEEDFFIKAGGNFWKLVKSMQDAGSKVIGYFQGDMRIHPCCLFVERATIDTQTQRDFGVSPDTSDHFYVFTEELKKSGVSIGYITEPMRGDSFYHLNGLSQNLFLLQTGEVPNYNPPQFRKHLEECLKVDVPLHPDFVSMAEGYIAREAGAKGMARLG